VGVKGEESSSRVAPILLIALYMVQVSDFDRLLLRNQFRTMVQSAIADAPKR